jgi:polysaccharide export outer membrane protein
MPEQMVDSDGRITVPFAGRILAAGHTPQEISHDIATLDGKAHQPQVIVRLVRNAAATVTVVGDVPASTRFPQPRRVNAYSMLWLALAGFVNL